MAIQKLSLITILMVICKIFGTEELMESPDYLSRVTNLDVSIPTEEFRQNRQAIEIEVDYVIDIEVTVSDIAMVNDMRDLLRGTPFPHPLTNTIKISEFAWLNDSCLAYTPCDDIIQGTCRCINGIPSDGQFCQPQPRSVTNSTPPTANTTPGSVTSTTISTPNTTAGSLTNTTTSTAITTAGFATNSTTAPALATSRLATSSPTSIPNTTAGMCQSSSDSVIYSQII
nr:poly(A) polymerase-like [Paramormyrops kingsleyae]